MDKTDSLTDIQKQMDRNNRILNLCLGIRIAYEGNVPLTEERKKMYNGNFGKVLREMVADNIRLDDITACFNALFNSMWGSSKPDQQLTSEDIMKYVDKMIIKKEPKPNVSHGEVVGHGFDGLVMVRYDPAAIAIGERLDDYSSNLVRKEGKCPVCHSKLLEGPRGGLSVNVKCEGCGRGYNASPLLVERIS